MLSAVKNDPTFQIAALGLLVFAAEWLARRPGLRHVGSAMIVIVLTAVVANLGLLPTYTEGSPIYDAVFSHVAPLAIFWLLLGVDLTRVFRAGGSMVALFLVGAVGTFLGVMAGMSIVNGEEVFGEHHAALGGMFVGTYTGGSVNFNAVALQYGINEEAVIYAGATAVDNIMTAIWMAVTLGLPRWLRRRKGGSEVPVGEGAVDMSAELDPDADAERAHPRDIGAVLALGAGAMVLSHAAESASGGRLPSILVLTTLALLLAPFASIRALPGPRLLGMFAVLVFLAVIGALCDLDALAGLGSLGPRLLLFVAVVMAVHGTVLVLGGRLLRADPDAVAVASQANVGGGTTALAVARSLGRGDLALPAILVGSLGTAVGTYAGFFAAGLLSR